MQIVLYKKSSRNVRYYSISDWQPGLFHPHSITVYSGNKPESGTERAFYFDSEQDKNDTVYRLAQEKIAKGYRVLYSYFKKRNQASGLALPDFLSAQ